MRTTNTHYAVKIEATQLLLDHIEDTFVTPVFNGSASLRDAAGQLIENVVKSCRRGETVDDAYFEKLYSDVNSLYRLDQTGAAATGQRRPRPAARHGKGASCGDCCRMDRHPCLCAD